MSIRQIKLCGSCINTHSIKNPLDPLPQIPSIHEINTSVSLNYKPTTVSDSRKGAINCNAFCRMLDVYSICNSQSLLLNSFFNKSTQTILTTYQIGKSFWMLLYSIRERILYIVVSLMEKSILISKLHLKRMQGYIYWKRYTFD